jgi:hypothetical protein
MASIKETTLEINGVIDTNKTVMTNIQQLANACGSWVTFDINQGKWAVVINRAGTSAKSFDDSNIIGSINISGTGLTEFYNKVQLDFPHKDLLDQSDTITVSISEAVRFENEFDNTLNFSTELVNDPIQAEYLATLELKQSRLDKVIQFRTDFSSLGLKAGDLIDVTSEIYDYDAKLFRIVSLTEEDGDDNNIVLSITALEYDDNLYDTSELARELRDANNGIINKYSNSVSINSDQISVTSAVSTSIANPNNSIYASGLIGAISGNIGGGGGSLSAIQPFSFSAGTALVDSYFNDYIAGDTSSILVMGLNVSAGNPPISSALFLLSCPSGTYDIEVYNNSTSSTETRTIQAYVPCLVNLYYYSNYPSGKTLLQSNTIDWQTPNLTVILSDVANGTYTFEFNPVSTYDLNNSSTVNIPIENIATDAQASGGAITFSGYFIDF